MNTKLQKENRRKILLVLYSTHIPEILPSSSASAAQFVGFVKKWKIIFVVEDLLVV